jgi:MFS family permease
VNPDRRTADLYQWYATLTEASFWVPVFFLYFASYMPLDAVLSLEALYFLSVVTIEVPSGWLADRIGRRPTLLAGAVLMAVSHLMLFIGPWVMVGDTLGSPLFVFFAVGQGFRAAGHAFRSGTDTALHHDALAACGRVSEFADREARASKRRFLGAAAAALVGGGVAVIDLRLPYACSFIVAIAMIVIVARMREPTAGAEARTRANILSQAGACLAQWKSPALLLLFVFAAMMLVLNHLPYEYFQPYIEASLGQDGLTAASTPLVTGLHVAVTFWIASIIGARSIRIRNRVGLWGVLLIAMGLQVVTIGLMSLWLSPVIVVFLLLRSCPRALMTPPLNAAVTGAVPTRLRATYLSMQSFVGRLCFSGTLFLLTFSVPAAAATTWSTIGTQLRIAAIGSLLLFGFIAVVTIVRGRRDDAMGGTQTPNASAT